MSVKIREEIERRVDDPGAYAGFKGNRSMGEWVADAILPLLSTLPADPSQRDKGCPPSPAAPRESSMAEAASRHAAPLDADDGKRLREKMACRYFEWTGRDLGSDLTATLTKDTTP